jgi:hypothetical protein
MTQMLPFGFLDSLPRTTPRPGFGSSKTQPRNHLDFGRRWWRDRVNNDTTAYCSIMITDANSFTRTIHDRMPVILDLENVGPRLTADAGT